MLFTQRQPDLDSRQVKRLYPMIKWVSYVERRFTEGQAAGKYTHFFESEFAVFASTAEESPCPPWSPRIVRAGEFSVIDVTSFETFQTLNNPAFRRKFINLAMLRVDDEQITLVINRQACRMADFTEQADVQHWRERKIALPVDKDRIAQTFTPSTGRVDHQITEFLGRRTLHQ
jgi:hypothetical protein